MTPPPLIFELVAVGVVLVLVLGLGLLAALFAFKGRFDGNRNPSKKLPAYVLKQSLVTPAERSFLGCLDSVLPPEIRVLVKVRLADIFSVETEPDRKARTSAFNRLKAKHVDFMLCRSDDLAPLAAIELDDKSHERADRQERDAFLDLLFSESGIRLLRFKAQKNYDLADLAEKLNEALQVVPPPP